jgi:hypothetical protein
METFAYLVYTVNSWGLTREFVTSGVSADQVADEVFEKGYRTVEVAPASPANGFEGMSHRPGDTAKRSI